MSQIGQITIADGEATPVNHVFSPMFSLKGESQWSNRVGPTPLSTENLVLKDNQLLAHGKKFDTVTIRMQLPTVADDADGIPGVVYFHEAVLTLHLPLAGTTQERDNLITLVKNLLADSVIDGIVQNRDVLY